MRRRVKLIATFLFICGSFTFCFGRQAPHYVFVLPDGYIGWVRIMFTVDDMPSLVTENGILTVEFDDSGIVKTRDAHMIVPGKYDKFFYRKGGTKKQTLVSIPTEYVDMRGIYHGGFTATRDGGVSWFFFIGPSNLRDQYRWRGDQKHILDSSLDPVPGMTN